MKRWMQMTLLFAVLLFFTLPGQAEENLQTVTTNSDGLTFRMEQTVYPVGTPYIWFTIEAPEGGTHWYLNPGCISHWENGEWQQIGSVYSDLVCYFAGTTRFVLSLSETAPLEKGLYQIWIEGKWVDPEEEVSDFFAEDAPVSHYEMVSALEFRVAADAAPMPPAEEIEDHGAADLEIAPHQTPHHAVDTYNSSADVSRRESQRRTLLLVEGTVFELVGAYNGDFDWYPSRYWLFAYPEGKPDQARLAAGKFTFDGLTLYDTGEDFLLEGVNFEEGEPTRRYWRMDYDGGRLRSVPLVFPEEIGPKTESAVSLFPDNPREITSTLLIGDTLYLFTGKAILRAELGEALNAECIYQTEGDMINSHYYGNPLFYGGEILFAEAGAFSVDWESLEPRYTGSAVRAIDLETLRVRTVAENYSAKHGQGDFSYFVLGDRLYLYDVAEQATVSLRLDGTDKRIVSPKRFSVYQIHGGTVLAAADSGGERSSSSGVRLYDAPAPENPTFDPDHGPSRPVGEYDFFLGDWLYHENEDGSETLQKQE